MSLNPFPIPSDDPVLEPSAKNRLFKGPMYRDSWVAAIFLMHVVLIIAGATYNVSSGRAFDSDKWFPWARNSTASEPNHDSGDPSSCIEWHPQQTQAVAVTIAVTVVVAAMMASGWMALAARRPLSFLRILLVGYVVFFLVTYIAQLAVFGFNIPSLFILVLIPLYVLWWRVLWQRAEFSASILQKACQTVVDHKMTVGVAFFMILVSLVYKAVWVLTLGLTTQQWHIYPLILFLIWSELIFVNIAHTTICGVAATDFFVPEGVDRPVWGAFRRSCTYSLGSICLGSAVVAIIRFLRMIAQSMKQQADNRRNLVLLVIACCLEFFFSILETLTEYFNRYAFVQVAMYGKSFTEAAKDTWRLVKNSGLDAVINDMVIGTAVGMCNLLSAIFVGVICALVSYFVSKHWWSHCDNYSDGVAPYTAIMATVGALVVLFIQSTVLSVLDSAVVTFFVCFVEEPEVLALKHPELELEITRRMNAIRNA